jgi:hypothetical protein
MPLMGEAIVLLAVLLAALLPMMLTICDTALVWRWSANSGTCVAMVGEFELESSTLHLDASESLTPIRCATINTAINAAVN